MTTHPPLEPDDQLLPRIAAGDRTAFAALFRRRQGDVYRFALHMTGSAAMAEDVTQDVFVAVMEAAARSFRRASWTRGRGIRTVPDRPMASGCREFRRQPAPA